MIEVLAPAGGPGALEAAVRAGANAVYLGMGKYNARQNAENFTADSLARAVGYCHARGVRVHLTLNTLAFDDELAGVAEAISQAARCGVDALLVQDLGVAAMARAICPSMPLHASTQLSIHTPGGAQLLESMGFSRVVLARELSLAEIAEIARNTRLEIETFVHGALCMSLSGQCQLSALIGGRSGNRGLCAQPCRLPFSAPGGTGHDLSLKDLSYIRRIPQLVQAGVCSLKIEGRMKRPEYVAAATAAVRAAVDGTGPDAAALDRLQAVFSRSGFTDGYLDNRLGRGMFGTRTKEDVTAAGPILRELEGLYRRERNCVAVDFRLMLAPGAPARLQASCQTIEGGAVEAWADGPEPLQGADLSRQRAETALGKTGDTPFFLRRLEIEAAPGLSLPVSALNGLRREALGALLQRLEQPCAKKVFSWSLPACPQRQHSGRPRLRLRFIDEKALFPEAAQADEIVLPLEAIVQRPEWAVAYRGRLIAALPEQLYSREAAQRALLTQAKALGVTAGWADNLAGLALLRKEGFAVAGGAGLNLTNFLAARQAMDLGARSLTLSTELQFRDAEALARAVRGMGGAAGLLAYGRLPAMRVRNCPLQNGTDCSRCGRRGGLLTDRQNARFFVRCAGAGSVVYNSCPLYLADRPARLEAYDFITLLFTDETAARAAEVFAAYRGLAPAEPPPGFTRGLYQRGLQGR